VATTQLPPKNSSNLPLSGCQLPLIQWQNADPPRAISSASGKRQLMTMQIRIFRSTEFAFDLNTRREILSEVKNIVALIGHCACAGWRNSAFERHRQWRHSLVLTPLQRRSLCHLPFTAAAPPCVKSLLV